MGLIHAKCPQCWDQIPCGCEAEREREACLAAFARQQDEARFIEALNERCRQRIKNDRERQKAAMTDDAVTMDWADAMRAVEDGLSVYRQSWDDKTARVQVVKGMLSIFTGDAWHIWHVSQDDIIGKDWAV
jgi:hypothetical protein